MVEESGVVEFFGVKRYHPIEGCKKFIVSSYDDLPTEADGWYDSHVKAREARSHKLDLPPEIAEAHAEATKVIERPKREPPAISPGVRGQVSKLLKGQTLKGYTGLSLKSFASLYGEVNPKTKKALKPLYETLIKELGDKIKQNRFKQYVYKG
jgi:hypothetical protein